MMIPYMEMIIPYMEMMKPYMEMMIPLIVDPGTSLTCGSSPYQNTTSSFSESMKLRVVLPTCSVKLLVEPVVPQEVFSSRR